MFLQINLNKFCISNILSWKYPIPLWLRITMYKEHIFSFSPFLPEKKRAI